MIEFYQWNGLRDSWRLYDANNFRANVRHRTIRDNENVKYSYAQYNFA